MKRTLVAFAAIAAAVGIVALFAWAGTTVFDGNIQATTFVGAVTGAVTGNVTGNLTGNSTGTHTGAVTGAVTGNTAGTHTGAVVATTISASGAVTADSTAVVSGTFKASTGSFFSKAVVCSSTVGVTGVLTATGGVTGDVNAGTADVDTLDITGSAVGVGKPALPTASVHAGRLATNAAADTLYWSDGTNWQQVAP